MIPTYVSYRNSVDNLSKTLGSVLKQPMVERETEYFNESIANIHSVDDFMNDTKLYNYVTKAMGLEEMSFAKAMIRKVLTDDDFASRMTDKRYAQFNSVVKEIINGKTGGTLSAEMQEIVSDYANETFPNLKPEERPNNLVLYFDGTVTDKIMSGTLNQYNWAQTLVADEALSAVVFTALGASDKVKSSSLNDRVAWLQANMGYEDLYNISNRTNLLQEFQKNDQGTAAEDVVNNYLRQSLEEQVGASNEGARLALYFSRTIGDMIENNTLDEDSWAYQILSDKALTEVVFTALGISQDVRKADIEAQKKMLESRLSFEELQDPKQLDRFIGRFSAMYDSENQVQYSPALMILESSSIQNRFGFSNDTMIAIQKLNRKSW